MDTSPDDVRRQRRTLMTAMPVAIALIVLTWAAVWLWLPPPGGMETVTARLLFALKCGCVALLFTVATGIEAVAHERLHSAAIDPLSGHESRRMRVNLRYLQQTLEQFILFLPGLLVLAAYCADGRAMRAIVAASLAWTLSRAVFWIGYHRASRYRAFGLGGMVQSLLVLLYVAARFGHEIAGLPGALVPLLLFGAIELCLVRLTARPERPRRSEL